MLLPLFLEGAGRSFGIEIEAHRALFEALNAVVSGLVELVASDITSKDRLKRLLGWRRNLRKEEGRLLRLP